MNEESYACGASMCPCEKCSRERRNAKATLDELDELKGILKPWLGLMAGGLGIPLAEVLRRKLESL